MGDLVSSMQAERFRMVVKNCADSNNLHLNNISGKVADITLSRKNGQGQQVFLTSYDSTVEFMALTDYEFSSVSEMPGLISTHLLQSNSSTRLGFWSVTELGEDFMYSVIYNSEIDQLTPKLFRNVLVDILNKIDELEHAVTSMTRSLR